MVIKDDYKELHGLTVETLWKDEDTKKFRWYKGKIKKFSRSHHPDFPWLLYYAEDNDKEWGHFSDDLQTFYPQPEKGEEDEEPRKVRWPQGLPSLPLKPEPEENRQQQQQCANVAAGSKPGNQPDADESDSSSGGDSLSGSDTSSEGEEFQPAKKVQAAPQRPKASSAAAAAGALAGASMGGEDRAGDACKEPGLAMHGSSMKPGGSMKLAARDSSVPVKQEPGTRQGTKQEAGAKQVDHKGAKPLPLKGAHSIKQLDSQNSGKKRIVMLDSQAAGGGRPSVARPAAASQLKATGSGNPSAQGKPKAANKAMSFAGAARPTLSTYRVKPSGLPQPNQHQPPPKQTGAPGTPAGRSVETSPVYEPSGEHHAPAADHSGPPHANLTLAHIQLAAATLTGPSVRPHAAPSEAPSAEGISLQARLASLMSQTTPAIATAAQAALSAGTGGIMASVTLSAPAAPAVSTTVALTATATAIGAGVGGVKVARLATRLDPGFSVALDLEGCLETITSSSASIKQAREKAIECAKEKGCSQTMRIILQRMKHLSEQQQLLQNQKPAKGGSDSLDANSGLINSMVHRRLHIFFLVDSLMQRSQKTDAEDACRDFPRVVTAALRDLIQGAATGGNNLERVKRILEIWETKSILEKSVMQIAWEIYFDEERRISAELRKAEASGAVNDRRQRSVTMHGVRDVQISLPASDGVDPPNLPSPLMQGRNANLCGPKTGRIPAEFMVNPYGSFGYGLSPASGMVLPPTGIPPSGLPPDASSRLEAVFLRFGLRPVFVHKDEEFDFEDAEGAFDNCEALSWKSFFEGRGIEGFPEVPPPVKPGVIIVPPVPSDADMPAHVQDGGQGGRSSGDVGLTPVDIVSVDDEEGLFTVEEGLYDNEEGLYNTGGYPTSEQLPPPPQQQVLQNQQPLLAPLLPRQQQQQQQQQQPFVPSSTYAMPSLYSEDNSAMTAPDMPLTGAAAAWESQDSGFMFAPGAPTHNTASTGRRSEYGDDNWEDNIDMEDEEEYINTIYSRSPVGGSTWDAQPTVSLQPNLQSWEQQPWEQQPPPLQQQQQQQQIIWETVASLEVNYPAPAPLLNQSLWEPRAPDSSATGTVWQQQQQQPSMPPPLPPSFHSGLTLPVVFPGLPTSTRVPPGAANPPSFPPGFPTMQHFTPTAGFAVPGFPLMPHDPHAPPLPPHLDAPLPPPLGAPLPPHLGAPLPPHLDAPLPPNLEAPPPPPDSSPHGSSLPPLPPPLPSVPPLPSHHAPPPLPADFPPLPQSPAPPPLPGGGADMSSKPPLPLDDCPEFAPPDLDELEMLEQLQDAATQGGVSAASTPHSSRKPSSHTPKLPLPPPSKTHINIATKLAAGSTPRPLISALKAGNSSSSLPPSLHKPTPNPSWKEEPKRGAASVGGAGPAIRVGGVSKVPVVSLSREPIKLVASGRVDLDIYGKRAGDKDRECDRRRSGVGSGVSGGGSDGVVTYGSKERDAVRGRDVGPKRAGVPSLAGKQHEKDEDAWRRGAAAAAAGSVSRKGGASSDLQQYHRRPHHRSRSTSSSSGSSSSSGGSASSRSRSRSDSATPPRSQRRKSGGSHSHSKGGGGAPVRASGSGSARSAEEVSVIAVGPGSSKAKVNSRPPDWELGRKNTSSVPAGGVPAGGVHAGGVHAGGVPGGRVPAGGVPAGGVPAGGVPAGGVPAGGVPAGGVPPEGVPAGGVPAGRVPASGVPRSSSPPQYQERKLPLQGGVPASGVSPAEKQREKLLPQGGLAAGGRATGGRAASAAAEGTVADAERAAKLADGGTARAKGGASRAESDTGHMGTEEEDIYKIVVGVNGSVGEGNEKSELEVEKKKKKSQEKSKKEKSKKGKKGRKEGQESQESQERRAKKARKSEKKMKKKEKERRVDRENIAKLRRSCSQSPSAASEEGGGGGMSSPEHAAEPRLPPGFGPSSDPPAQVPAAQMEVAVEVVLERGPERPAPEREWSGASGRGERDREESDMSLGANSGRRAPYLPYRSDQDPMPSSKRDPIRPGAYPPPPRGGPPGFEGRGGHDAGRRHSPPPFDGYTQRPMHASHSPPLQSNVAAMDNRGVLPLPPPPPPPPRPSSPMRRSPLPPPPRRAHVLEGDSVDFRAFDHGHHTIHHHLTPPAHPPLNGSGDGVRDAPPAHTRRTPSRETAKVGASIRGDVDAYGKRASNRDFDYDHDPDAPPPHTRAPTSMHLHEGSSSSQRASMFLSPGGGGSSQQQQQPPMHKQRVQITYEMPAGKRLKSGPEPVSEPSHARMPAGRPAGHGGGGKMVRNSAPYALLPSGPRPGAPQRTVNFPSKMASRLQVMDDDGPEEGEL